MDPFVMSIAVSSACNTVLTKEYMLNKYNGISWIHEKKSFLTWNIQIYAILSNRGDPTIDGA